MRILPEYLHSRMGQPALKLLLADDDIDDNTFFKDALEELPVNVQLETVYDGVELMQHLTTKRSLPDAVFLDLNMPRKNGFECLSEIKSNEQLKALLIIIFSTSFNPEVIDSLYEKGADYYIRKPGDFAKLRAVIHEAVKIAAKKSPGKPEREKFVLEA